MRHDVAFASAISYDFFACQRFHFMAAHLDKTVRNDLLNFVAILLYEELFEH